jgi:NAD(P)-dependent dehydrogenase (short-subunit alcohol dehydrogenase family)
LSFTTLPDYSESSYYSNNYLAGHCALITNRDSGIRRAITIVFAREGTYIAINYLLEEEEDAQALSNFLSIESLLLEKILGNLLNKIFCTNLVY